MSFTYKYPRPALTVDAIVFRKTPDLQVLLIQRLHEPFKEMWAFPGGFVDMDEIVEVAVERELEEETALTGIVLKQFQTFSAIDRDPRHRTVSVVFYGFANEKAIPKAGDDAKNVRWFGLDNLPELAFDHQEILKKVVEERLVV